MEALRDVFVNTFSDAIFLLDTETTGTRSLNKFFALLRGLFFFFNSDDVPFFFDFLDVMNTFEILPSVSSLLDDNLSVLYTNGEECTNIGVNDVATGSTGIGRTVDTDNDQNESCTVGATTTTTATRMTNQIR